MPAIKLPLTLICHRCGMPRPVDAYRVHTHTMKGRRYTCREKTCRACENFARRVRYWKAKQAREE